MPNVDEGAEQRRVVLVIEDDDDLRNLVVHVLRRAGFSVVAVPDGNTGLQVAAERRPELVLLDVRLPDLTGREVCRRLRASPGTAGAYVILVSGMAEERDRVAGFEAGADDYVAKPYSMRELVLRLKAAVRRLERRVVHPPVFSRRDRGETPPVRVDRAAHRVYVGDEEIELTLTEYRLLSYLIANSGRLCSRAELLQKVWDMPPHLNTRTVDTHVKRVRNKLGQASASLETVRGAGYRFNFAPGANGDPAARVQPAQRP